MTPEMNADRWQTIDRLFHSTLSCAQEKRAGFLSQACGDDEALRVEVESLLRAHEQDGSFLDLPAYEVAVDFHADAFGGLFAGQQIGPYKIISPLAGGADSGACCRRASSRYHTGTHNSAFGRLR